MSTPDKPDFSVAANRCLISLGYDIENFAMLLDDTVEQHGSIELGPEAGAWLRVQLVAELLTAIGVAVRGHGERQQYGEGVQ